MLSPGVPRKLFNATCWRSNSWICTEVSSQNGFQCCVICRRLVYLLSFSVHLNLVYQTVTQLFQLQICQMFPKDHWQTSFWRSKYSFWYHSLYYLIFLTSRILNRHCSKFLENRYYMVTKSSMKTDIYNWKPTTFLGHPILILPTVNLLSDRVTFYLITFVLVLVCFI